MKKLITIILALIMTFLSAPKQGADRPHVTAEKPPQTSITTQAEQVPEEIEMTAETAFVNEVTEVETKAEVPKEEAPTVQETITEEAPSNVLTKASKTLRNINHKSAVSLIPSRTTHPPRSMTDR